MVSEAGPAPREAPRRPDFCRPDAGCWGDPPDRMEPPAGGHRPRGGGGNPKICLFAHPGAPRAPLLGCLFPFLNRVLSPTPFVAVFPPLRNQRKKKALGDIKGKFEIL